MSCRRENETSAVSGVQNGEAAMQLYRHTARARFGVSCCNRGAWRVRSRALMQVYFWDTTLDLNRP